MVIFEVHGLACADGIIRITGGGGMKTSFCLVKLIKESSARTVVDDEDDEPETKNKYDIIFNHYFKKC